VKPATSIADVVQAAADLLKLTGFEFRNASMKTESCYYALPGRRELLRLSAHSKKKETGAFTNVVTKLTFNGNHQDRPGQMRISPDKIDTMVAGAIGRYMLACGRRDAV